MKKFFALLVSFCFLFSSAFAQESGISADSFQNSSQNSVDESSNQSSDEASWGESTAQSSDETSEGSSGGDSSGVILAISGTLVAIGLTAGGIALTVKASRAKKQDAIGLQDQIYRAEGREYRQLLAFFDVDPRTLGRINDELAAEGLVITTDQDAAVYIARLVLKLAESSDKVKAELSLL